MNRPYAESAEQNRDVILEAIRPYLKGRVLEIGSGTGQHAVHFAAQPSVDSWQTTDLAVALPGIRAWIDDSGLDNLPPPFELDVTGAWPQDEFDLVYTANTFHIISANAVARAIAGAAACLVQGGVFVVYGPFNYGGEFTAPSNARFDQMLRARDPASGIRDFEWLDERAREAGLDLLADIEMPQNNRTLVWQKRTL